MHVYRFRMLLEDQDDFIRDLELKADNSFLDLHNLILHSVDIEGNELASFFLCDQQWNKNREITLLDMNEGLIEEDEGTDIQLPVTVMRDTAINQFIEDPHQRIIYEYDFLQPLTFYLELVKVLPQSEGVVYPLCTVSKGKVPKRAVDAGLEGLDMEQDELLKAFEEMLGDSSNHDERSLSEDDDLVTGSFDNE